MSRRVFIAVAVLVGAAAAIAVVSIMARAPGAITEETTAAHVMPVEVARAEMRDGYEIDARYAGRIVSRRTSNLGFERGGLLARVTVDEGARVAAGDVMAVLDTRSVEAQLAQARAAETAAEARLRLADVTVGRQEQLVERQTVSKQRYDESRFERQAVAAELEAARANVSTLETALALASIEAPYDGHVVARMADEGTVVAPGQPIFRLRETGALEAHIGIPPSALDGLAVGETYQIEVRGESYPAILAELIAEVDMETQTVAGIFRVDAPPGRVRSGELARLELDRKVAAPGFWVPLEALTEGRRGLWSLYALAPASDGGAAPAGAGDGLLERRAVQLLHAEGERAYVRGTVVDGEAFVASGTHRLVPGQRVRVADPAMLTN